MPHQTEGVMEDAPSDMEDAPSDSSRGGPHQTEGCSRGGCPIRQRDAVGEGVPSWRQRECPIRQRDASDRGMQ